jgi:hypothetical protein
MSEKVVLRTKELLTLLAAFEELVCLPCYDTSSQPTPAPFDNTTQNLPSCQSLILVDYLALTYDWLQEPDLLYN